MQKLALTSSFLLLFGCITHSQPIPQDSLYLGQIPPGNIRQLFNLVTDPGFLAVEKISISPDGSEIYYEETNGNWTSFRFKQYKYSNNHWNEPVNLFNNYYCLSLSPDGNSLYFENNNYNDAWISNRQDSVWNSPLRFLVNFNVHSLNCSGLGNYYLSSNLAGGLGQRDICKLIVENSDTSMVGLGCPINSTSNEGDFFISNDESFIIIMSNRPGGFGNTDLYISYRKNISDNSWTNPKNLGTSVNTSTDDFGPYVTADHKYLFYESGYNNPGSIYWIRVDSLIDSLRYTNYIPYLKNSIHDQIGTAGMFFDFTIPDSTFIDDDGNNTLTYSARLTSGNPLPAWLTLDSLSGNFSGTPPGVQTLNIKVIATDNYGGSAFTTFKIFVEATSEIYPPIGQNNGFRIFPNPSEGVINITSVELPAKTVRIEVCNLKGDIILEDIFQKDIVFSLADRPKGMYFIKLIEDHTIIIRKLCLK